LLGTVRNLTNLHLHTVLARDQGTPSSPRHVTLCAGGIAAMFWQNRGDQRAIKRLVYTLLDGDDSAVKIDKDGDRDEYVTVGFKACAPSLAALDTYSCDEGWTNVRTEYACGDSQCRDRSCRLHTPEPNSRVLYCGWGAVQQFRDALGTPLLPHELVGFLLRFCPDCNRSCQEEVWQSHGSLPAFNACLTVRS
jgi:hypothetical protein